MSITIDIDNGSARPFTVILSKRDLTHLGEIVAVSGMKFSNTLYAKSISFHVAKRADDRQEPLWDQITDLSLVYIKEINTYFEIKTALSETDHEVKFVEGKSLCECELSQRKLYNIEINTETDIERADYQPARFYDPENPKASLLHRILESAPAYSVKYVSPSLSGMQRSFSIGEATIYDFLTGDCAKEFHCLFTFDSTHRGVSVYDLYTVCPACGYRGDYSDVCPKCGSKDLTYFGEDTTILVSAENLTDEIQLETDVGNIKNCFRLEAGDEVMTAAVMSYLPGGGNRIYYVSEDQQRHMPQKLVERIRSYNELYDSKTEEYSRIAKNIYDSIEKITYYTSKQMPEINLTPATAQSEADKLTTSGLSPLSLSSLTSYTSLTTINNALVNYAKVFVRSGFVKVEADRGSFAYSGLSNGIHSGVWTGRLKVTSYADKNDVAYSPDLTIIVNDDHLSFVNEKIRKNIASNNSKDNNVYDVLSIQDLDSFSSALGLYGLNRLVSFRDALGGVLSILQEAGAGSTDSELHAPFYAHYYDKLGACNSEIQKRRGTIEEWEKRRGEYERQKEEIQDALDFRKYLGEDLYRLFTTYIREDTYSNANYISDGLSDDEIFKKAQEFLETARRELIQASHCQRSIQANLYNLLLLEEFAPIAEHFELGSWIRVKADEKIYRLRLVSYEIDFDSLGTIHTEFSDALQTADGMTDVQDILSQAGSMASTYSYVARQASVGCDADRTIEKMRQEGLDSALYQIKNSDSEEIVFGKNGLIASSYDDISDSYSDKKLIITHNVLGFTTDNFRTMKSALGEMKISLDGTMSMEYGLNADFCISSKIIAGNIYSADYSSAPPRGTRFNLDDGTFTLADGKIAFDGNSLKIKDAEIDWSTTNESPDVWAGINANSQSITAEIKRAGTAEGALSTQVTQNANQIVLKADANGNLVAVKLGADPSTGSKFSVNADNISLSANDVLDIIAGGTLNLTSGNLSITSDNFKVDSKGNVQCTSLEALELKGQAVEQFNKAIFDSATMKRVQEIIDILDSRTNTLEAMLTNNKILFDLLDQQTYYWNQLPVTSNNIWTSYGGLQSYVNVDTTGYKYLIVRCRGRIDSIPSGQVDNHQYIVLTFSYDPANNNPDTPVLNIVHKFRGPNVGEGQKGEGPNGEGYASWYNAYIDISALTGTHELHCFCTGGGEGYLWCSKMTLTNQEPNE